MTKGVTFYFVRHGETYLNRLGRFQGWADAPLTPEGLEIVHQSGRGLADVKFDAVYTSDLGRTIKTAQILLEENHHSQDLTITPMPEFREVFFGYYEGLEAQSVWRDMIAETNHELGLPRDAGIQVEATMNKMKASDPTGLAENYLSLDKEISYHVICQKGGRSARACEFLEAKGYQVTNVEGGVEAYPDELTQ